jgi:DNA polymerase I-like protein with 3'-5' exonuclease and polymerase domains
VPDTEEKKAIVDTVVTWALTSTTKLIVPIEAEGGFGSNWAEAKH